SSSPSPSSSIPSKAASSSGPPTIDSSRSSASGSVTPGTAGAPAGAATSVPGAARSSSQPTGPSAAAAPAAPPRSASGGGGGSWSGGGHSCAPLASQATDVPFRGGGALPATVVSCASGPRTAVPPEGEGSTVVSSANRAGSGAVLAGTAAVRAAP